MFWTDQHIRLLSTRMMYMYVLFLVITSIGCSKGQPIYKDRSCVTTHDSNEDLFNRVLRLENQVKMLKEEVKYHEVTVLLGLALGKHAEQSSTLGSYGSEYAVDGNRGTDIFQDKCTHTGDGDTNPWWRVDLQAVYSITSVRILNRGMDQGGDFSNRLRDVTVTVGPTESDVNTPCGFFPGPGTASQLVVINCPTSPQGRFVKISKTTSILTLCEVDVFGVSV